MPEQRVISAKRWAGITRLPRGQENWQSVLLRGGCSWVLYKRTGAIVLSLLVVMFSGCRLQPPGLPDYYGIWTAHPEPGHTFQIIFFDDGTGFWTYDALRSGGIPHFHFKYKVNYSTSIPGFHEIDFFDFESMEAAGAVGFLGIVEFALSGDITKVRFEGVWIPADQRDNPPMRPKQFSNKATFFTRSPRSHWELRELKQKHLDAEQKIKRAPADAGR